MSGFDPAWLALREPADSDARSARLTRLVGEALGGRDVLRALDLATGTGSNARYLRDRLPGPQEWLLVDHDPALLAEASARMSGRAVVRRVDLVDEMERAHAGILANQDLVTASALLDLVSERWLRALAAKSVAVGAAVLFALSYNGEIECAPDDPEDAVVRDLVNRHQRRDKGFGPALGPTTVSVAAGCFAGFDYHVEREQSRWVLGQDARELQQRLIDGWAAAAAETAPDRSAMVEQWRVRRHAHVAAGRSRLIVGHEDLAAWP